MNQPWLDESIAPNGRPVKENFRDWFDGSCILDAQGQPMVLYRGQRKSPRDDGFTTTHGRACVSFTDDREVANVYAGQSATAFRYGPGSTIVAAYVAMKNPLDLRHRGEKLTLDDLIMDLRGVDLAQDEMDDGVGYHDLANAISGFDTVIFNTNARWDISALDGKGYHLRGFEELANRLVELGDLGDDEQLSNLLYEVEFDTFVLADSVKFKRLLRRLGYDGVIHTDVFDVGLKHYQGDKEKLEDCFHAEAVITAYRPFDVEQIKSAYGNSGLYLKDSKSITDHEAARALLAAQRARDVVLGCSARLEMAP